MKMGQHLSALVMAIALLQIPTISRAADDRLLEIPEDSKNLGSVDLATSVGAAPGTGRSQDEYVKWVMESYKAQKKNFAAYLAYNVPVNKLDLTHQQDLEKLKDWQKQLQVKMAGARCLYHKEAFSFEFPSATEVTMRCMAAKPGSRAITHALTYKFNVKYNPEICATEAEASKYFSDVNNRRSDKAMLYYGKFCMLTVNFDKNPVVNIAELTPSGVNKILEKNPKLSAYVRGDVIESSKKVKDGKKAAAFSELQEKEHGAEETE